MDLQGAKGRYMIVLDDDSHLESRLNEALAYLDINPQIGILALKITIIIWKLPTQPDRIR